MTIAYWCIFIAGIMPYFWVGCAKFSGKRPYNNHAPRKYCEALETRSWRKRAYWAHLNQFESFPLFAAAVLSALLIGKIDHALIDQIAVAYIIARLGYGVCYLTDKPTLRSLHWFIGVGLIFSLFFLSR